MAVTATPVFVQTPQVALAVVSTVTGLTAVTLLTGGTNGSKVVSLTAASTNGGAIVVSVAVVRSAVSYTLGTFSVPANSGTDGATAAFNILGSTLISGLPVDNDGQLYLFLATSADSVTLTPTTTVSAGKNINFTAIYGNF